MKRLKLFSALLALLTLTSCGDIDLGIIGGADGPTVTVVGKKADETDTVELPESTADAAYEAPAGSAPSLPDKDFTELDGDLQFYRFDDGNAAVVWNESDAWVFDFVLDTVVDMFDNEKALTDIDIRGDGAGYFEDYSLDLEFFPNNDYELRIMFNVRSTDGTAEYTAYSFYSLNSPVGTPRGEVRGYYYYSMAYPGSDEPLTITDVSERDKLGIAMDSYIYPLAAAFATMDISVIEENLRLSSGTLSSWESIEVSDYYISRTDFSSEFPSELLVYLNITKSDVERLPVGRYEFRIFDGIGPGVEITNLDVSPTTRTLTNAEEWLNPWVASYGGHHVFDMSNFNMASYSHHVTDFYLYRCGKEEKDPSYEEFLEFISFTFGVQNGDRYVSREEIEAHGGHGGSSVVCEITGDYTASGIHIITVDFFADPMKTVIARTNEYVLHGDDDRYVIAEVRNIYDSGLSASGLSI